MGKKITLTRVIDVTELGRSGGKATAANRTPKQRTAAAKRAIKARWDAYYQAHPEKLKTKRSAASRKAGPKKTMGIEDRLLGIESRLAGIEVRLKHLEEK